MAENKEKKKFGLIIFIVVIMIGTTFGSVFFGFSPVSEKVKYKEYTFTFIPNQNIWISKINGRNAAFSLLPSEVENVMIDGTFSQRLKDRIEIDVTSDANSTFNESIALAQHQMGLTLSAYQVYVRKGFTTNNTFNFPIIKCEHSTVNVPVVYFRNGNETKISVESNCIIAEASSDTEFIRVKDRLLYGILGVIK